MRFKKYFILLIIISLSPFNPLNVSGAEVTLRLSEVPRKSVVGWLGRADLDVFSNFKKKYPDIKIEIFSGIKLEGPGRESGFYMSMAGGTAPDVITVGSPRELNGYINEGFLYPLDEYFNEWEAKKNVPGFFVEPATRDGSKYAIPSGFGYWGLYYRKDKFRDAGFDPESGPETWDELYEYAKKMTIQEKGQVGFGIPAGFMGGWFFQQFVWQAGGRVVTKDEETGLWKATFHEEPGVKALSFYKKLAWGKWERDGKVYAGVARKYVSWGDMVKDLHEGKVAMILSAGSSDKFISATKNPTLFGMAGLPAGPTGKKANLAFASYLGINGSLKGPKNKEKRDAAWKYINYITGYEADSIRVDRYIKAGFGKFIAPDKLERYGHEEYLADVPKSNLRAYNDLRKHGRNASDCPKYQHVTKEMTGPIDKVLFEPDTDVRKVLKEAAYRTDKTVLGYEPKETVDRKKRLANIIFFVLIIGAATGLIIYFRRTTKKRREEAEKFRRGSYQKVPRRILIIAFLFMAPALLSVLLWQYLPLFRGIFIAFLDYKLLGASKFIWLDNFIKVFSEPFFWQSMYRTLYYVGLTLALGFVAPIILALLLSEVPKGKIFFRLLFYLPAMTSGLVIMFMWKWFYEPTETGLLNVLLSYVGIPMQRWLESKALAMLCIIIPGMWAGAGAGSLIYLAALKNFPEDVYEAADLDGASTFQKIWSITLPQLLPLLIINFVGVFIGAFHAMQNVFVMTGGGPDYATHVIGIQIFYDAFLYLQFGQATAIAWVLGIMLIGFTIYQLKIFKKARFTTVREK